MVNDTISRRAAIDALWEALYEYEDKTEKQFQESEDLDAKDWIGHRIFVQNMNDIDRRTILNLPSAQSEWIPVSERSPKENGWYQCTVISNDLPQYLGTMDLFYKNGKWFDNRRVDMYNTYDIFGYGGTKEKHKLSYRELVSEFEWTENVIAWKQLSRPYKPKKEEK